ncbi:dynein axonemal heavy chain 12-like isoform X5 [Paramormyrops kingsleyae]|uniref:dynein axonemal heavy chain 12-like isoform X5 n=1 Tax=Paramormyrops kingsleyae TaxID=1676925 RepID=UPI000CD5CCB5|nr:ankyrin repeat and SOCS box protein 15-like isoform X4 [Paramormyrops kingsleyae]
MGWGDSPDTGRAGRPSGEREGPAGKRSFSTQHERQKGVPSSAGGENEVTGDSVPSDQEWRPGGPGVPGEVDGCARGGATGLWAPHHAATEDRCQCLPEGPARRHPAGRRCPARPAGDAGHAHSLCNVNAQACNGESVLMEAAGSGNPDCVELLLRRGANPDLAGVTGHLPIHRAAYEGHYLALKILIPVTSKKAVRLSGQSPVHSAADGGHAQCLRLLIENGYEVNTVLEKHISENYGDRRRSPLYFAVSNGDVPCTEMLLNAGARPDRDPLRCLLVAIRAGCYKIVRLLLSKQAEVNCYFTAVSDTVFPTALQYCLRDDIMMRLLLNHGYAADRCFCCHHDDSVAWHPHWSDLSSQLFETYNPEEKIPFCNFIGVSCLLPLAGHAVRILLDYVGHVSLCTKLRLILERQKEWPVISEILGNPRPLKHLCRLVIRKQVTLRRLSDPRVIDSAPFPHRITDYLLYREHDLYSQNIGTNT